jgi:PAS domain S-box-containing protein
MKITNKITIAFLLTSLIFLIGLSTLFYVTARASLTEQALHHLESVASVQAQRIKQIVGQNLERLRLIASRTQLRLSLKSFVEDARPEHQSKMNQILDDAKASIPDLMHVSVLTLGGEVVASTDREDIGSKYSDKEFFVRGKEGNCADIFILDENQNLRGILSGLLSLENRPLGVVVIKYSPHNIVSLAKDYTGLDETGETLLAQRDKNGDARFLTALRFDPNAALRKKRGKNELGAPIIQALNKREDLLTEVTDYRGKSVLAATRYIPETDWGLVAKMDKAEAFSPIIRLRNLLGITIFISSIAIIAVSFYIANGIVGPVRELVKGAKEIGRSNLDYRIVVRSKDELGILSQTFNEMAGNLQEVTASRDDLNKEITDRKLAEEALRQSREELAVRHRIAEIFLSIRDEEMYGEVLRTILEAMQSKYGIFGYIDEHGALVIPSMTTDIWEECQVPDKRTVYPPETWAGIWGRALVEKKSLYANEGLRVPEGHLPIINVLVVPVTYGAQVIGLIEVANKTTDYDEKDVERLETIAVHIAPILSARLRGGWQDKERKRAEEALLMSEREVRLSNRIAEIFLTTSDKETYGEVLEVVLEAMQSKFGTFAYINEKGERIVPSMTRGIWDKCEVPDKTIVFPRETWGDNLWAKSLIQKRAIASNGPFKVPDGHIPITRALAVPIIHQDEAIGNFMVGNKVTDYDETDVELLQKIAARTAPILHARLQTDRQKRRREKAEKKLKEARDELELRVEERTAELEKAVDTLEKEIQSRKQVEKELSESEERYRTVADFTYNWEYWLGPEREWRYISPSCERLTGYTPEQLSTKDYMELMHIVHPDDREAFQAHIANEFKSSAASHLDFRIISRSGETRWIAHSCQPVYGSDGEWLGRRASNRDITGRKKAEAAFRESQEQLRRLSSQLLEIQESERKRISRELHDSTGQSLATVKFGVESALVKILQGAIKQGVESLETLVPVIQLASDEVRRIHTDLRPPLVDDLGIIATISWFCREFQKIHVGIRIEKQIHIEEKDVPEPLRIVMFRILQEALNNVTKHGKADLVRVALERTEGRIDMVVVDNGHGFDVQESYSEKNGPVGVGLTSMKERVELSGGSLLIESSKGSGTTLRASWPAKE